MPLPSPTDALLFAQEMAHEHAAIPPGDTFMHAASASVVIVPILLAVGAIVLTAIVVGVRYARRERELEHAERLKALEMGRMLPKDAPLWTPNTMCVALGAGLPLALFLLALAATRADRELMPFVWPVAGALGGIGIICGTLLALILPRVHASADASAKPSHDPDAYDTVGRRGWDAPRKPTHA